MAESIPKEKKDGWLLLKAMPWSRRKRRALFLSDQWHVHLSAGPEAKGSSTSTTMRMKGVEASGVAVTIDLQDSNSMDLMKIYGVFRLLLWAGAAGKVITFVGGPPTRSFLGEWAQDGRGDCEVHLLARMLVLYAVANEGRRKNRTSTSASAMPWSSPPVLARKRTTSGHLLCGRSSRSTMTWTRSWPRGGVLAPTWTFGRWKLRRQQPLPKENGSGTLSNTWWTRSWDELVTRGRKLRFALWQES